MSDHDLHTMTGAYAADALPADERAAFETHLETCAVCRQEVAELTATTARLAVAVAEAPPAGMRERVLAEAARTRQVSPRASVTDLAGHRDRRSWLRSPASAAAAVLLVVAAGLGSVAVAEHRSADDARQLADRIAAVVSDPDKVEHTVAVNGGGTATLVVSHGTAVFHASDMTTLPEGRAYQLWRINGQESTSAGVLGRGGDVTRLLTELAPTDSLGVTVEPASGSDQPTTTPVVLVAAA